MPRLRPATRADIPRISEVRLGVTENRLGDPSKVSPAEVEWYVDHAITLVSEDETGIRGFTCVNHLTGLVWALFVEEAALGAGHGKALLSAAMARLRDLGHAQAHLSTDPGTRAARFYARQGWEALGETLGGETAFRLKL